MELAVSSWPCMGERLIGEVGSHGQANSQRLQGRLHLSFVLIMLICRWHGRKEWKEALRSLGKDWMQRAVALVVVDLGKNS